MKQSKKEPEPISLHNRTRAYPRAARIRSRLISVKINSAFPPKRNSSKLSKLMCISQKSTSSL
jgi:hypothetical protein